MNRTRTLFGWLEDKSDWLSPIIVKEVRQVMRGREFNYSFGASLVAGLAVAFFGAADALTGTGASGQWTFLALTSCLAVLGLGVVPLGAFSALRNERLEQTLELITLTALSPRRIVTGKLLAQGVKLATLFAAMAPFVAMSFLLGGIDFVTIAVALAALFMWSLWACAACLFLSTLLKSRAMSGLVFGGVAIVMFLLVTVGRSLFMMARWGGPLGPGATGSLPWWTLAIVTTFCLATMINLVLLAENRLSLPTDNRVPTLRLGFLAQFLLIIGWTLTYLGEPAPLRTTAVWTLGFGAGLHLAAVAMFVVTEDQFPSRRTLLRLNPAARGRWFRAMFLPGGGHGALYVLAQMALLVSTAWLLGATGQQLRWLLAICGYICFFTGMPTLAFRVREPRRAAAFYLRVAVLVLVPAAMLLPDIVHYVLWQPEVLNLGYGKRHLVNPLRTLANWRVVEASYWFAVPVALGLTGLFAYLALIVQGASMTADAAPADPRPAPAPTPEAGNADVTY